MSYLVFARKWRPKDFDEVVGQEHVTKNLKGAIAANKLAHAYLFAGSQGVGKTSCARIFAKSLNCVKGPTVKPCGECSACMEISEGRSLDVIEIDGASNRGIEDIRTLRENVKFAPLNGRYKIYIIDEVHMLTAEAFNALLKTLEEPPPYVKFVFATTHPQKVLPTILSRCQRFDFIRIPNLKIVDKLKSIAEAEKAQVDNDVFFAIAKACEGSMRDAESILDQLISFTQKDIKLQDVVSVLGIIEQDAFINFVNAIVAQDATMALKIIDSVMARGKDVNYFLEGILEHYRNLMVLKVAKSSGEELVDLPQDTLKKLVEQASKLTLSDIMVSINHIFAAQDIARKLNDARIPIEILAVKLSLLGQKTQASPSSPTNPGPQNQSVLAILKEEKGSVDVALTSFAPSQTCSLEDVVAKWDILIKQLSQVKMSLATYLKEAKATRLENNSLTLGFPKNAVFFKEAMAHKDNLKIFGSALKSVTGMDFSIKLEIVDDIESGADINEEAEESPLLKSTLDLFNGRVVKKA